MKNSNNFLGIIVLSIFVVMILFISLAPFIESTPVGVSVTSNSSSTLASVSTSRADDGGTITTLVLNADQQDVGWKGYVGNVTGKFTLDDSEGYSIYDWTFTVTTGEVYISRAASPNWSNPGCAGPGLIDSEQVVFGMLSTDYDNINKTFNETVHKNFRVGTINITNSTCPTAYMYVNDTKNDTNITEDLDFQEVLLQMNGTTDDLVYVAILETNQMGYNENYTFDFQAIVPDNESFSQITTYYFWAELGY